MFYDILQGLCRKRGLTVTAALQIMGVSSGNISHWKKGRLPKGKTLRRMAQFFDVSIDFLIGDKQRLLAAQQERLLSLFANVPEARRESVLTAFEHLIVSESHEGEITHEV